MDRRMNRRAMGAMAAAAALFAGGLVAQAAPGGVPGRPIDRPTPPGRAKVAICHLDRETGLYTYKQVPKPALRGHGRHGDVIDGVTGPEFCEALNSPAPEPIPTDTPAE